ncbi:MAG: hypothetical protein J1F28_09975 [Oscillospiraceae bacterium]|nr:hypothetical protein [Oscillospiraceae bacterium]
MKKYNMDVMNMKRFMCAAALAVLLTGCSNTQNNNNNNNNSIESNPITWDLGKELEIISSKEYVNLNFGSCPEARLPSLTECYNIKAYYTGNSELTNAQKIEKFEEYCVYYFGECDPEYALFEPQEYGSVPHEDLEINGISYSGHPKISDHKDKLESGEMELSYFVYRNIEKNQYLWWLCETSLEPHWFNRGQTLGIPGDGTNRVSSWIPSDLGEPSFGFSGNEITADKSFRLLDGELSVSGAVKFFEGEYFRSLPFEVDDDISFSVHGVDVYNVSDDVCAFNILFTPAYKNIPLEYGGEYISYNNNDNYFTINGQALMIKKNDIDVALHFNPPVIEEVGEPIKELVSLESAADIVSEKLSQEVMFDVRSVEMIYRGKTDLETNTALLNPSWKFTLFNSNDGRFYNVYIDAVSGECSYYSYSPL